MFSSNRYPEGRAGTSKVLAHVREDAFSKIDVLLRKDFRVGDNTDDPARERIAIRAWTLDEIKGEVQCVEIAMTKPEYLTLDKGVADFAEYEMKLEQAKEGVLFPGAKSKKERILARYDKEKKTWSTKEPETVEVEERDDKLDALELDTLNARGALALAADDVVNFNTDAGMTEEFKKRLDALRSAKEKLKDAIKKVNDYIDEKYKDDRHAAYEARQAFNPDVPAEALPYRWGVQETIEVGQLADSSFEATTDYDGQPLKIKSDDPLVAVEGLLAQIRIKEKKPDQGEQAEQPKPEEWRS